MSHPTGEEVWNELMRDPNFAGQPESLLEATKPFVVALPEVLKDHLDNLVTLGTLLAAKVAYLKYLMENNYVTTIVAALPQEAFDWGGMRGMTKKLEALFVQLIETYEPIIQNVPEFLVDRGIDEENLFVGPDGFGLGPELVELYKAGTLTIGDILRLQPLVIYKNSDLAFLSLLDLRTYSPHEQVRFFDLLS